jgi:RNA polymerase sigma-70 factor (ECF subfamily)
MEMSFSTDTYINDVLTKYSNMVYRLALTRTMNISDAEDVLQEVFLRLIRKRPQFESEEHTKAWLIRVAINCSHHLLSSAWFRKQFPLKMN